MSGSLLIAWQLQNKSVLIVGGGEVASQRIDSILGTNANLIVLSPSDGGLHPRTMRFIRENPTRITHWDRKYSGPQELDNIDMVLTALDDVEISKAIVAQCRSSKIPVNAADIPEACDFYFGAQIRDGPLQIMISTNGNGPRLAALIKRKIQLSLSGSEGKVIEKVGTLRKLLKDRAPGVGGDVGRQRMKWMTELCNKWEMEELAQLDEEMMKQLLDQGWTKGTVPSINSVGGSKKVVISQASRSPITSPALAFVLGGLVTASIIFLRPR